MLLLTTGCGTPLPTGEETPENMPWLFPEPQIELLTAENFKVCGLALKNLARMGAKAEPAIPAIEKMLDNEKNDNIRALGEKTLSEIREASGAGS